MFSIEIRVMIRVGEHYQIFNYAQRFNKNTRSCKNIELATVSL